MGMTPAEKIDERIAELGDWRGELYAQLRALTLATDPDVKEEWKWGTAVWTYGGKNVCAVAAFKAHVKINFFHGQLLSDPKGLFNSGLNAKDTRGIDFFEGDTINKPALQEILHDAITLHSS
jgi:hypothetical protein